MELTIGDYGKYLFEQMTKDKKHNNSDHWESIRKKSEPLVRELIKLNSEMKGGGYILVGYVDESGKEKLPDHKRILLAQEKLWNVKVSKLAKGDRVWLNGDEPEMYIGQDEPGVVEAVSKEWVYVTLRNWEDYTKKIHTHAEVLRAPKDWMKNEELYSSDKYWLEQADKLGI